VRSCRGVRSCGRCPLGAVVVVFVIFVIAAR
jgi:hypothetical protein